MCVVMFYLKKPGFYSRFLFYYLYIILMKRFVESKQNKLILGVKYVEFIRCFGLAYL